MPELDWLTNIFDTFAQNYDTDAVVSIAGSVNVFRGGFEDPIYTALGSLTYNPVFIAQPPPSYRGFQGIGRAFPPSLSATWEVDGEVGGREFPLGTQLNILIAMNLLSPFVSNSALIPPANVEVTFTNGDVVERTDSFISISSPDLLLFGASNGLLYVVCLTNLGFPPTYS